VRKISPSEGLSEKEISAGGGSTGGAVFIRTISGVVTGAGKFAAAVRRSADLLLALS
jgi:hypothetical protein